jgi:hypothetical protein
MTRARQCGLGAAAAAAILVAVGAGAIMPRTLTVEDADLIRSGMNRAEVERLLGRPPDHETQHPGGNAMTSWDSQRAIIYVFFKAGRVDYTLAYHQQPEPLWKPVARRIGLTRKSASTAPVS